MKRFASILFVLALAPRAFAQPDVPPGGTPPPEGTPPGGENGTAGPTTGAEAPIDDHTRAIIAEEVRKALAEERAGHKSFDTDLNQEKPKDPNADPLGDNDYLSGYDGFMDTRLDLTFVSENVLVKPSETIPSVPGWRFGVPNSLGTLFFDNYDTRYSGYETMSHVTLYKNYRRDHLEVEGGLVMRLNDIAALQSSSGTSVIGTNPITLTDDGSYILVSWWKDPKHVDPHRISFTAFPVSADRFRLGYSYRLSWGGNDEYQRVLGTTNSALPAAKVQFDGGDHYAFLGMKSAVVLNHRTNNNEARLGFLAGAGVDVGPDKMVRLEVNGGYFNRGPNELQDVQTQDVQLFGGSAQIAIHKGMPVTSSLDYKLYKNDPERIGRVFQPVVYKPGVSWLVMSEATLLGQTLKDPEKTGSTKIQYGKAGDINVRVMMDRVRLRLDLSYRDLAFVMHSVPSIPSYSDFPTAYEITPDFFGAVGVDRNWADRLTLGVIVGIEKPAAFTAPSGVPGDVFTMPTGSQTVVVRNNGGSTLFSILPAGQKPVEQFAVKGTARIDFGAIYAALINVYYTYDGNMTIGTRASAESEYTFKFGQFNQLGGDITLQAKF